jgi:hypothetical protein
LFLKKTSLDWALRHVTNEGDTDLFPQPFEFVIIKKQWPSVRSTLRQIDITSHNWEGPRRLMVPKSDFAFLNSTRSIRFSLRR